MTQDEVIKAAQRKAFEQARVWLRRPYVRAVAFGMRKRAGNYVDAERCVVVTIDQKYERHELAAAKRRAFPSEIRVRVGRRRVIVPVDVQVSDARYGQLYGLPGRKLAVAIANELDDPRHIATVGFLVMGEDGSRYIMTAGHAVEPWFWSARYRFGIWNSAVELAPFKCVWNPKYDHALLKIIHSNILRPSDLPTGAIITGVADRESVETGDECYVFRAGRREPVTTIVRDPCADSPFQDEVSRKAVDMKDLIAVDRCTERGDSGTALLDREFRLIGTLVGEFAGKDHFCPCDTIMDGWKVALG